MAEQKIGTIVTKDLQQFDVAEIGFIDEHKVYVTTTEYKPGQPLVVPAFCVDRFIPLNDPQMKIKAWK